ncbi:MAG TPA: glycosyltransferase [Candidatus Binatia bacterium]|nr:glycosyltransferase [Candidatus Binatia bacterium]
MRVAIIHDWLITTRGGEKCLEAFCELFPRADVYTLIYRPNRVSTLIKSMRIRVSRLDTIPGIERIYRYFLPLFPRLIESFDLRNYDLIVSSSHCVAKGVFPYRALHIAYVHAPMRYVWDMHDAYFGLAASLLARIGMSVWRRYLQRWDVAASERVDYFLANSRNVAAKIQKLYGRQATVIHPPVDLEKFRLGDVQESYYLIVSALVPYKRIDIAVRAFNKMRLPLKVVGEGPLRSQLERSAGSTIEFLGWVDDAVLAALYGSCQALIFPGEEDFGIVPLEAQACGRPVIAYEKGGVLETVIPVTANAETGGAPTGIFFSEQTPGDLIRAVELYQRMPNRFDPKKIRAHAAQFSAQRFRNQIHEYIQARLGERWGVTNPC